MLEELSSELELSELLLEELLDELLFFLLLLSSDDVSSLLLSLLRVERVLDLFELGVFPITPK